ncbi:hypothetical protein LTR85_003379 [Meristemomyces frigidus]|nr:hypothetical protein LTR85_003379 [Meristemomyces frigidus]
MAATATSKAEWSHRISPDDHGPYVTITACLMLTAMMLFFGIRMAIRWPWTKLIGLDDVTTIIASIIGICQSVCVFEAVHYGVGRHAAEVSSDNVIAAEKAIYASDLLFIVAVALSKLAVALLILRLTSSKAHVRTAHIMTGLTAAWGTVGLLAIAIRYRSLQPWDMQYPNNAAEVARAWIGVGAVGILLDLMLIVFPVFLVYDLQMPLASKLTVIIGFAFRLPASVITILRLVAIDNVLIEQHAEDITWNAMVPVIYQQIELHYTIIAATIPCMRLFLKNFNTGYLGTTADQVDPTATMAATKGSNSYAMSSVRSRHMNSHNKDKEKGGDIRLRPDVSMTTSKINHDTSSERGSITSDGSDKIIIRKTVHVDWGQDR